MNTIQIQIVQQTCPIVKLLDSCELGTTNNRVTVGITAIKGSEAVKQMFSEIHNRDHETRAKKATHLAVLRTITDKTFTIVFVKSIGRYVAVDGYTRFTKLLDDSSMFVGGTAVFELYDSVDNLEQAQRILEKLNNGQGAWTNKDFRASVMLKLNYEPKTAIGKLMTHTVAKKAYKGVKKTQYELTTEAIEFSKTLDIVGLKLEEHVGSKVYKNYVNSALMYAFYHDYSECVKFARVHDVYTNQQVILMWLSEYIDTVIRIVEGKRLTSANISSCRGTIQKFDAVLKKHGRLGGRNAEIVTLVNSCISDMFLNKGDQMTTMIKRQAK